MRLAAIALAGWGIQSLAGYLTRECCADAACGDDGHAGASNTTAKDDAR